MVFDQKNEKVVPGQAALLFVCVSMMLEFEGAVEGKVANAEVTE